MEKKVFNLKKFSQSNLRRMEIEEWENIFKPVVVHPNGSFNGWMLETYGEDLDQARRIARNRPDFIWTIMDNQLIVNGFHTVNRFGYIITQFPYNAEFTIEVYDSELEELEKKYDEENKDEEPEVETPKSFEKQILEDSLRLFEEEQ